jgi:hypothetical protein
MKSKRIENESNEDEIRKIGSELIIEINSILKFIKDEYIPIDFDSYYIGECNYMLCSEHLNITYDAYIIDKNRKVDLDNIIITKTIKTFESDNLIKKVLSLYLRKGIDWVNLYRLYEVFEENLIDPVTKGWITKDQERVFKHTANSPKVIGNEARHGKQPNQSPKDPMNLHVAHQLMKLIIFKYIEEKNA